MTALKVANNIKTQATEALIGSILGGGAGYASEKKDEKTKKPTDKQLKRTRTGVGLGFFGGSIGGQALRHSRMGMPFSGGISIIPEQVRIINKANDGFYPFGIGLEQYKKASLAEYSVLFDTIDSGELGPHVKEALFGVCEGMSSSLQSHHAKVASESIEFSEADARQARLDQLLRRY
jgi:hypothetical protein